MQRYKMQLIKQQISFFVPSVFYGNLQNVLKYFMEKSGSILDAQPIILPLPEGAPVEIPKFIMRSKDNTKDLQFKVNRIDMALVKPYEVGVSESERKTFEDNAIAWILPFAKEFRVLIDRVGVAIQRALIPEGSTTPSEFISQKYCKQDFLDQPFRHAKSFGIHCLKKYNYLGHDINSWVRIQTLDILPSMQKVVGVLNDLNHLPQKTSLTEEGIKSFIKGTNDESLQILKFYQL